MLLVGIGKDHTVIRSAAEETWDKQQSATPLLPFGLIRYSGASDSCTTIPQRISPEMLPCLCYQSDKPNHFSGSVNTACPGFLWFLKLKY